MKQKRLNFCHCELSWRYGTTESLDKFVDFFVDRAWMDGVVIGWNDWMNYAVPCFCNMYPLQLVDVHVGRSVWLKENALQGWRAHTVPLTNPAASPNTFLPSLSLCNHFRFTFTAPDLSPFQRPSSKGDEGTRGVKEWNEKCWAVEMKVERWETADSWIAKDHKDPSSHCYERIDAVNHTGWSKKSTCYGLVGLALSVELNK